MGSETAATRERPDSFARLLAFWVLVGFPLFGLGTALADALGPVVPLSTLGSGMLFGTAVVSVLWSVGVRPQLLPSLGYFFLQGSLGIALLVVLSGAGITVAGWTRVTVRGASIALAAVLAFRVPWGRVRQYVEQYLNPAARETGS